MRTFLRTLPLILMTVPLMAAEIIIPAAGLTSGANNSYWQSDLTVHNAGSTPAELRIAFLEEGAVAAESSVTVDPRETVVFQNVVGDLLGLERGLGALILETDELAARKLSVSSRTYTTGPSGQLGQDVPSYDAAGLAREGSTAIVSGPADLSASRFNFGIYAHESSEIEWVLYRADGTMETTRVENYPAGTQEQYSRGVETFLGAGSEPGDTIYARILSGAAVLYGSIIASDSNDPSFVPQSVTRENLQTVLLGIDYDEDGVIDLPDADGDGVVDQPLKVPYTGFPTTVSIVVVDPEGEQVQLSLVTEATDMVLYGNNMIRFYPYSSRRGSTVMVIVEATDGFLSTEYVIPVQFK